MTAMHKLTRLALVLTPAISIAATNGHFFGSDERLKTGIAPVESALDRLRRL